MGSNGKGAGEAVGKYTGKIIYIPKSKFDVFDIRKEYCLFIQSIAGFFNATIVGKIFGNF